MALEDIEAQVAARGWAAHQNYWIETAGPDLYNVRRQGSEFHEERFLRVRQAVEWIDRRLVLVVEPLGLSASDRRFFEMRDLFGLVGLD